MINPPIKLGDWVLYAPNGDTTAQRCAGEVKEVRGDLIMVRPGGAGWTTLVRVDNAEVIARA